MLMIYTNSEKAKQLWGLCEQPHNKATLESVYGLAGQKAVSFSIQKAKYLLIIADIPSATI